VGSNASAVALKGDVEALSDEHRLGTPFPDVDPIERKRRQN